MHEDLTTVAALRSQVDPDGMFRNPYVDRVFGLD